MKKNAVCHSLATSKAKASKNTVPFTLGDYPVDALDQEQMRQLKRLADQDGSTVEDHIEEALRLFVAKFNEREAKEKVIRFPETNSYELQN